MNRSIMVKVLALAEVPQVVGLELVLVAQELVPGLVEQELVALVMQVLELEAQVVLDPVEEVLLQVVAVDLLLQEVEPQDHLGLSNPTQ